MISPQEIIDEPSKWLQVPHKFHESIMKLMLLLQPDFKQRLLNEGIRCLMCDGEEPLEMPDGSGFIVGVVGKPSTGERMLVVAKKL